MESISRGDSLSLQTYEFFNGGDDRKQLLRDFREGEALELELDYPELATHKVEKHVANLDQLVWYEEEEEDGEDGVLDANPHYRLAEAYFLKAAARLNHGDPSQAEIDRFQVMNEQLYGTPDKEMIGQMLAKLWSSLEACRIPATQKLLDELSTGFVFTTNDGQELRVPALPIPEIDPQNETLQSLTPEALTWLESSLNQELAIARATFQGYFDDEINGRLEPVFLPSDIAKLFKDAAINMGIEINVIEDENATALSWSQIDGGVRVGMERQPVKTVDELLGLFAHEVYIHGLRSINGARLGVDSLQRGLFTRADADKNESPSYVTFEEGLATTVQKAIQGKKEEWGVASMGNYLNIAFASMGWTSRQVFEVMSRVRTVLNTPPDSTEVPNSIIEKAEKSTLTQIVRVFRATPPEKTHQTTDGKTLHYAKDLAYASGKVKAIAFLNELAGKIEPERSAQWKKLLIGKYDPTNHYQKELVESYLTEVA